MQVLADFDEELLKKIADATGARYFRAADAAGFAKAFTEIDALEKTQVESRIRMVYSERFLQALIPAGLLLGFELLLAGTRLRRIP